MRTMAGRSAYAQTSPTYAGSALVPSTVTTTSPSPMTAWSAVSRKNEEYGPPPGSLVRGSLT